MKGQESRPIWIVVTLLLALVVGITMYQLMAKTNAQKTFDDWLGEISAGQVSIKLTNFCENWEASGFSRTAINENQLAEASVAAAHPSLTVRYFTSGEFEIGERLSPCDCAVYLYKTGSISQLDMEAVYDPDDCHQITNDMVEDMIR